MMMLLRTNPAPEMDNCRLCGHAARRITAQKVLHRYDVGYYHCPNCDLMQTQRPFWLNEAYSSAISTFDTGAIQRCAICADLVISLAWLCGIKRDSPCLDYGGGHGVLTRAMRDHGYDFRWFDSYAGNIFARGFECDPGIRQSLLTCFEVWEHLPDVGPNLDALFRPRHSFVLVGTILHRGHREKWWYYTCESGQHVAFFSPRTMRFIARRYGYGVIEGARYTLFYLPGSLSGWRWTLVSRIVRGVGAASLSRLGTLSLALRPRLPGRTTDDHFDLMKNATEQAAQRAA